VLSLDLSLVEEMVAACLVAWPEEGCGLLGGRPGGEVVACYPTRNAAHSARYYEVDPGDYLRAMRRAETDGLQIIGAFHSHTHTDAYPSPTDISLAVDPDWYYVIVSFKHLLPSMRAYRIRGGKVVEEAIVVSKGSIRIR